MSNLAVSPAVGALAPPPGVIPNFTNPENSNALIYSALGVCVTITTALVIVRSYTRFFIIKRRGWEDYLLLISWFVSLIFMVMLPMGIPYGAGTHQWNVTEEKYMAFAERANIADIFYLPVICLVKLAILVQFMHIFAPIKNCRLYKVILLIIILTVLFYFSCIMFRSLACIPREKIWNPSIPGTCINSAAGVISSAIFNVISDFALFVIPISGIWGLQISTHKKWGITAVFATGLFGCISSIMRLVASTQLYQSGDVTYQLTITGLWCFAEITSGIICCCLPVVPQFYRRHISRLVTSLSSLTHPSHTTSNLNSNTTSSRRSKAGLQWDPRSSRNRSDFVELSETGENARDCRMGSGKRVLTEVLETELVGKGDGRSWGHDLEEGHIRKTIRIESESISGEEAQYVEETQYCTQELRAPVT